MNELLRRFSANPRLTVELLIASFFASVLALAMPIFVIQVLNRYVAHGVDVTLATLTVGALIAVVFEFAFRQIRLRLAGGLSEKADLDLSGAGFKSLLYAKPAALATVHLGTRPISPRQAAPRDPLMRDTLLPPRALARQHVRFGAKRVSPPTGAICVSGFGPLMA